MFVWDAVFALIIGLLLAMLVATPTRREAAGGGWALFWVFFAVIFLFTWAGGVWLAPFGPTMGGIAWAPFLVVGLIVFLILMALPPSIRLRSREVVTDTDTAAAGLGLFFWVLLITLLVVIAIGYSTPGPHHGAHGSMMSSMPAM